MLPPSRTKKVFSSPVIGRGRSMAHDTITSSFRNEVDVTPNRSKSRHGFFLSEGLDGLPWRRAVGRIPDEAVERLKRDVPIDALVLSHGVKLKRHGADLIGLCPFHADKNPSLVVSPAKNLWHCLGACRAGGSPIDWVMKAEGISFVK